MISAVQGAPRALLRAEGAVLLLGAVLGYLQLRGDWGLFAAAFLLPDLALLAYLAGSVWGARLYNLTHNTLLPALLMTAGWAADHRLGMQLALIWLAHVGFDRALGFGLKYGSGFADTHLGRLAAARGLRQRTDSSAHNEA